MKLAVAEIARLPLYFVTSGELGASPGQLEEGLKRALEIAKTFHAVLLLDEADVFLEQRAAHDLERNALVSIFLRLMEYYRGILVLTTNRIQAFDEAFHSRIHISLHYSPLTAEAREQIWRTFAAKMEPDVIDLSDEDYKVFAKSELNGREIKCSLGSCQALAAESGEKVSAKHVNRVLEIMASFDLQTFGRGVESSRPKATWKSWISQWVMQ